MSNVLLLLLGLLIGTAGAGLIWLGIEERVGFVLDLGLGFAGGGVACVLIGGTRALWALFKKSRDLGLRGYRRHQEFLRPVLLVTALVFTLLAGLFGHNYVVWYTVERDCELALETEDRVEAQFAMTRALETMDNPLLIVPSDLFDLWGPNRCRSAVERHQLVPADPATLGIDEPAAEPASDPGLAARPQLLKFNLSDQGYTEQEFIPWLEEQEAYNGLVNLVLKGNQLTDASIAALAESNVGVVHTLLLGSNPIGDRGAQVLASAPAFSTLTILYLPGTGLTATGVQHLFDDGSVLDFLIDLDLSDNDLGDAGAQALAESPGTERLTHLYLDNTGITDRGARMLADSPRFTALEYLSLDGNELSEAGASYLTTSGRFPQDAVLFLGERFE